MSTYAERTDAELLALARDGDRNAFAVLYGRWFDPVYDFLTRVTRNRDEAGALTQDAFLIAMQQLPALEHAPPFRSWLLSIAYRRILERLERRRRWTLIPGTAAPDAAEPDVLPMQADAARLDDPATAADASEVATLVWEAAQALDDRTFAILDLHVGQGLSSREIADTLDVKPNHADVLVNRMKERAAAAIGTYLLVRKGAGACDRLGIVVANVPIPPVTEELRRRVDSHVLECEICEGTRRRLLAPMPAYAALAAIPPPEDLKDRIWRTLDSAWPTGHIPSTLGRWRHVGAIAAAVVLVALLPAGIVLGVSALGGGAGLAVGPLTASPVDRTPRAAPTVTREPAFGLPPPPTLTPGRPTLTADPDPIVTETVSETNEPPVVQILSPAEGTVPATRRDDRGPYALIRLVGAANDPDTAPEDLSYEWTSSVSGLLTSSPDATVKLHIPDFEAQCGLLAPLQTAKAIHQLTLRVVDDNGNSASASVRVTVEVRCNANLPSDDPTPPPEPTPGPTAPSPEPTSTPDPPPTEAPGG